MWLCPARAALATAARAPGPSRASAVARAVGSREAGAAAASASPSAFRDAAAAGRTLAGCRWSCWAQPPAAAAHPAWAALRQARWASSASSSGDPYEVLGLDRKASADDVKAAYRRLALKWHPDRNPDKPREAEAAFKRVSDAYSVLSDPGQRAQYDRFGAAGVGGAGMGQARPMSEAEAAELFRQMFGNKPLQQIIREVEEAVEHQQAQMAATESRYRSQVEQLTLEAQELKAQAMMATGSRQERLMRAALAKEAEAQSAGMMMEAAWVTRLQQRIQAKATINNLHRLDPRTQAENRVRVGLAWGVAIGAYFLLGASLLQSVLVFIATGFGARAAFAVLRRMGR